VHPASMRLPVLLGLILALTAGSLPAAQDHAPLPQKLVAAKSVYLVNDSGDIKAFDNLYQELKKWNRFKVVDSQAAAEIVMILTTNAQYGVTVVSGASTGGGGFIGSATTVPNEYLWLKVYGAAGPELLWSDSTEKWITSGHAPSKLVSNLKKRMPKP
jgi:hypothetical protein